MAQRAISLRYLGIKLAQACEVVASQLQTAPGSLPEAVAKGMEAYRQQLTSVVCIAGAAMAPTFKPKEGAVENLLLRLIPRPSARTVFIGDVVAFRSPYTPPAAGEEPSLMVRRVWALEGDELECDDPEEEEGAYHVPKGHCWVLADNPELEPPHVIDSRSFGPLPLSSVVGRVVYSVRSRTNHGPVENSTQALQADAPVLEAELDIEQLWPGEGEGEGEGEQAEAEGRQQQQQQERGPGEQ